MVMDEKERRRAIDLALVQMDKQFGKGSVLRLGSRNIVPVDVISSGCISLDAALGVGGFPRGRVVEIFGPESSGKTTIARLLAEGSKLEFEQLSAIFSGVADLRKAFDRAKARR